MKILFTILKVLHGATTIFLGTFLVVMLTEDVSDFQSATFKKTLKQKEFTISKLQTEKSKLDSINIDLKISEATLNSKKNSLDKKVEKLNNDISSQEENYKKLNEMYLILKNKDDKKLAQKANLEKKEIAREEERKKLAKEFDSMKSKAIKPIIKNYDSSTIMKIYKYMKIKKELIAAMAGHDEEQRFYSLAFGARKPVAKQAGN